MILPLNLRELVHIIKEPDHRVSEVRTLVLVIVEWAEVKIPNNNTNTKIPASKNIQEREEIHPLFLFYS